MKLLVVADIHYSLKQYDWLITRASHFDCLVIAGDLLDLGGGLDRDVQAVAVSQYLAKLSKLTKVLVCSGNHDGNWKNRYNELEARWLQKARYDGVQVDGDSLKMGDNLISIYPWWGGEVAQKKLSEQMAIDAKRPRDKWIWIYHRPPSESPVSWSGKHDWGEAFIRNCIDVYSPDIVFSGHVHQSPFVIDGAWNDQIGKTWVFNTGREPGYLPTHMIFDTESESITWFCSDDQDTISLSV
ncbi:MAG: metallophosphoesterase [Verrucomicrobiota bacterium]